MEDVHHIGNDSVLMAHFFLLFNFLALTEEKKNKQMNFQQQKPSPFNELCSGFILKAGSERRITSLSLLLQKTDLFDYPNVWF